MMSYCGSGTNCPYRTDTGYCRYTGYGCAQEVLTKANATKTSDKPIYFMAKMVDLSEASIEKIADAVVKKLHQMEGEAHETD